VREIIYDVHVRARTRVSQPGQLLVVLVAKDYQIYAGLCLQHPVQPSCSIVTFSCNVFM
jgi:hypothetical protein